jgi:Na+/H+ antiporter NhaD/arsenite permease-like protein
MMCAFFMILFGSIDAEYAFEHEVGGEIEVLTLLFGTMLMVVYLAREHVFKHFEMYLIGTDKTVSVDSARNFMIKVCFLGGILSAFLTNDTVCVFFTPVVVKVCLNNNYPLLPFLVALATSANIGSAGTPIGNPQNMVVAREGNVAFGDFVLLVGPVAMLCLAINTVFCWYWYRGLIKSKLETPTSELLLARANESYSELGSGSKTQEQSQSKAARADGTGTGFLAWLSGRSVFDTPISHFTAPHRITAKDLISEENPRTSGIVSSTSRLTLINDSTPVTLAHKTYVFGCVSMALATRRILRRIGTTLICLGMLFCFLYGFNEGAVCLGAAAMLVVNDALFTQRDPHWLFHRVDWVLLLFFAAIFISVGALNATGLPDYLWAPVVPSMLLFSERSLSLSWGGLSLFSLMVVFLGNLVSNVPAVILIAPEMPVLTIEGLGGDPRMGWYLLAFVSTVAGNLTLIGSMASLIVAETASASVKAHGSQGHSSHEEDGETKKQALEDIEEFLAPKSDGDSSDLTFGGFTKFGAPTTVLLLILGTPILAGLIDATRTVPDM